MPLRVALVAEGDARTTNCWSGSGLRFFESLRAAGVEVDVVDVEPRGWHRALAAGLTVHADRARWKQRYNLGGVPFAMKSARAGGALRGGGYDAVIQIGGTFLVSPRARAGAPYVLYCDSNFRHALRGGRFAGASRLVPAEARGVAAREQRVYDAADRIWTMSDALRDSFVADFGQPRDKLRTIYAGANSPPAQPPSDPAVRGPVVLFIGKDHERKGSAMLLEAFDAVRRARPDAELHIVGGQPAGADRPGVVAHGFVSRRTPEGAATLDDLFARASVFCMPSHYEPFGIVFVEAMLAGLPCIGARAWAMPEIIAEGETGWLVPPGDAGALAEAMLAALADPARAAVMGARGRERALATFTWNLVAARAVEDLERLAARRGLART